MTSALLAALARSQPSPVLPIDLSGPDVTRLDFSAPTSRLAQADLRDTAVFAAVVAGILQEQNARFGLGGYLEERAAFRPVPGGPARVLHLGVDVWVPAGTPVLAPLPARVHSRAENPGFGPTVILAYELEGIPFFSLCGHLARREALALTPGQLLRQGEVFAKVGAAPENGDWPSHLHFQLIADLQGREGNFPGVAALPERDQWAALCPDPNLLLRSSKLS
ncbi:peptidoglycan DD-metalloendopeptidase family protein [Hymenobacter weizhouensis]|uniref:peptidoglycan DD-metalloendopeptidase family protein n=1 Tax=Hymenobacter sp. YIM 151500-1 TaxID=2987689 RepID=UPI00222721C0|nr:peptidoglycan DD-metalloendopeptidase family protein [Hymenobacter sp. YIM 151500-1]UYZ64483.1 peptidoglycan DD-metalloendopeptidase family protein [Hymenobacter sp. YIM 151500-1]